MIRSDGVTGPISPPAVQSFSPSSCRYRAARVRSPPMAFRAFTNISAESHPSRPNGVGVQLEQYECSVERYSRKVGFELVNGGNTERIQMFWLATQDWPIRCCSDGS